MSLSALLAWGKSTFTEWVSTGTVIIKIISSTNITSTSGVMLISLITSLSSSSPPPNAILACLFGGFAGIKFGYRRSGFTARRWCAGNKISVELMRKAIELAENTLVAAVECVVSQHCRDGDRKTEGRHNQGLTDRTGDFINAR